MKSLIALFLLVITSVALTPTEVAGQRVFSYNYNIYNGLPSNHVYGAIVDGHGYLWIATDKGVVKYNGYTFKHFGISDGLPTDDIWEILEDRKGRIWLGNISDEMGYLSGDQYHKAFLKGEHGTIYPEEIRKFHEGILFLRAYIGKTYYKSVCQSIGDTIVDFVVSDSILRQRKYIYAYNAKGNWAASNNAIFPITDAGVPYLITKSFVFRLRLVGSEFVADSAFKINEDLYNKILCTDVNVTVGNHVLFYASNRNGKKIYSINLSNGKLDELDISRRYGKGHINYVIPKLDGTGFYVVTNQSILDYKLGDGFEFERMDDIKGLTNDDEFPADKIFTFFRNSYWNTIIASSEKGLSIAYNTKNQFLPYRDVNLTGFDLKGGISDSVSFWWNTSIHTLISITNHGVKKKIKLPSVSDIHSVSRYCEDTFLLNSNYCYYFNNKTGAISKVDPTLTGGPLYNVVVDSSRNWYAIYFKGLFKRYFSDAAGKVQMLDMDKYIDIAYDSIRRKIISYTYRKLLIVGHGSETEIRTNIEKDFGIKKIEQLAIDNRFGNYFVKGPDQLSVCDIDSRQYHFLLNNLNLNGSKICVSRDILIVSGGFGVCFFKIEGKLKVSKPILFENIKNINYKFAYDLFPMGDFVLLTTDKGAYKISLPSRELYGKKSPENSSRDVRFIYEYEDSLVNFESGDTIILDQLNRRISLDVINPYGIGRVGYSYYYAGDSNWHELNANEINIPVNYSPDKYNKLILIAHDEVWRSDTLALNFFIKPFWYQTRAGHTFLWFGGYLLLILLLLSSVMITKKIVNDSGKKRTLRMELELKAIYSQINPHFIFNTLNSALLLVSKHRMDEAYAHISKFSRLLRNYIKSSRNKMITVADEIVNLKDYIDLQQTRFKNKFEYTIYIDPDINTSNIKLPSLLLQPFVENAINHGLLPMMEAGELKINFSLAPNKKELVCIIEDNGIGRKESGNFKNLNELKGESFGDLLIKDLVSIFNRFEAMNIEIEYKDKQAPEHGTSVVITIKSPQYAQ